jgi:hypothetical protein
VKHIRNDVSQFIENLIITTDLIDYARTVEIRGHSEESILRPEEFSTVNMGVCPVLDVSVSKLKFNNYGKYPVTFEVKASYPLKVNPMSGTVPELGQGEISIMWNPSGAYELKSQLTMVTNIGSYIINVRGKSTFPDLRLLKSHIDFGMFNFC